MFLNENQVNRYASVWDNRVKTGSWIQPLYCSHRKGSLRSPRDTVYSKENVPELTHPEVW